MTHFPLSRYLYGEKGKVLKLSGEVNFPGTYSIKLGETLFEVIQRAGGLTPRAFADGALFSRENLRKRKMSKGNG